MRPKTLAYLFGAVYLLLLAPNVFLFSSMYKRFMHSPEEQPLALMIGLVLELSAFLLTVVAAQYGSRVSTWFKTGAYLALVIVWVVCGLEVYVRNPLGYIWDELPVGTSSVARVVFAVMGSITALFTVILGHAMGQMMRLEMGDTALTPSPTPKRKPSTSPLTPALQPLQNAVQHAEIPDIVQWAQTQKLFTVADVAREFSMSIPKARAVLQCLDGQGIECRTGKGWRAV